MKPPAVEEVQNALYMTALENLREGRDMAGRPLLDLEAAMKLAARTLEVGRHVEERYGKN